MEGGDDDGDCLRRRTESYFSMVVVPNRDFVCTVFRSCLPLLPEAEQTAFLASRCIEALFYLEGDGGSEDGVVGCAEELKAVSPEVFKVIVDSMQRRFTRSHDLLYRVVDLYFLVIKVYFFLFHFCFFSVASIISLTFHLDENFTVKK